MDLALAFVLIVTRHTVRETAAHRIVIQAAKLDSARVISRPIILHIETRS